jgi:hypothetical protein
VQACTGVPSGAVEHEDGMGSRATARPISRRWRFMAWLSA